MNENEKPIEEEEPAAEPEQSDDAVPEELSEGFEDEADPILALEEERDLLQDKLLRAFAEMENLRKRADRERRDAEAYGGSRLARDLLPVYDNLDRAIAAITDEQRDIAASVIEGIELTKKELLNVFAKHKIERIAPGNGEKFDPKLHQAMFEAPLPGAEPGTVIQVMAEGFTISGRLLRPAQVGVAAGTKT
ncbi:MAG: nucleotide exchange factor GrpE [Rubricella sp.]